MFHFAAQIKMSSYIIHHLSILYTFTPLFKSQKIPHTCWCFSFNKMNRYLNCNCNLPLANPAGRATALEKQDYFSFYSHIFGAVHRTNLIIHCQAKREIRTTFSSKKEKKNHCLLGTVGWRGDVWRVKLSWAHRSLPFLPSMYTAVPHGYGDFPRRKKILTGCTWLCCQGLGRAEPQRDIHHLQACSQPWTEHECECLCYQKGTWRALAVASPSAGHRSTISFSICHLKRLQA